MRANTPTLLSGPLREVEEAAGPVYHALVPRAPGPGVEATERDKADDAVGSSRIRCPQCEWRPSPSCRWYCAECPEPEGFFGGCGTMWNTFETRGRCPGCDHQWRWTSCLACSGWSPHDDWYVVESAEPSGH